MSGILEQIALDQRLHQFIPVQLADHAASIIVVGNIGGIFCQQVANDLIDGVLTLFVQGVEHCAQNSRHIFLVIAGNCELNGVFRHRIDLLPNIKSIIPQKNSGVKSSVKIFISAR